jgi:hypothetical protein
MKLSDIFGPAVFVLLALAIAWFVWQTRQGKNPVAALLAKFAPKPATAPTITPAVTAPAAPSLSWETPTSITSPAPGGASVAAAATPVPAGVPDANRLLLRARVLASGVRVDPVVPSGTPGTVTLPKTGHVLSLPQVPAENFMGYCTRVVDQCSGNEATLGALLGGMSDFLFPQGFNPDGTGWPEGADKFYNVRAYMTPEEVARDAGLKAQWDALAAARAGK